MNESRLHRLTRGLLPVILLLCVAFPWLAGCMPGVANEVLGEAPILGEFLSTAVNGSAAASDTFGISAAVDGDYALAGAPSQTIAGVQAGGAYVYRWSGSAWGEEFQLSIPAGDGPAAGDDFGRSVGISGDYLIVGATNQAGGTGAAYIFQRTGQNTWGNPWRVQDAPSTGLGYGQTVAISGDHAIVAATGDNQGHVYVYERVGPGNVWSLMDTITGSDSVSGDQFGRSIGISGSAIIVGAYISGNGKAYVFRLHSATWVEEAILASTDATSGDNFGAQVAIGGNSAAVTARNHDGYGSDRGAVYFYRYSGGWSSGYKTIASAVEDFGEFGTSVRISGDNAVVSAFLECSSACAAGVLPAQGALYALRRDSGNTWRETKRITAPDAASNDRLGFGIGLSGNSVVAGAAFASPGGLSSAGKIYFFH